VERGVEVSVGGGVLLTAAVFTAVASGPAAGAAAVAPGPAAVEADAPVGAAATWACVHIAQCIGGGGGHFADICIQKMDVIQCG